MPADLLPWSQAWEHAAFGMDGFYRRASGNAEDHFRTAVRDDDDVARRIADRCAEPLDELLREHARITVTDVGAGDGTLLGQLLDTLPPALHDRVDWRGIDVRERPHGLDRRIRWVSADVREPVGRPSATPGLVVAHELLDDIPLDVLEVDDDGALRLVLVEPATGHEVLGPPLDDVTACRALGLDGPRLRSWAERWWGRTAPAARVEAGPSRDRAWQRVAGLVSQGVAIAVDYGHERAERESGAWDGGTLVGYRDGRVVSPVPDGRCNLTAHVALDSCAHAVPARSTRLLGSGEDDGFQWLVQEVGAWPT